MPSPLHPFLVYVRIWIPASTPLLPVRSSARVLSVLLVVGSRGWVIVEVMKERRAAVRESFMVEWVQ